MKSSESFFQRKFGNVRGEDVIIPQGMMREAAASEVISNLDELRENARKAAYDAILAQRSFTEEEIIASRDYLTRNPEIVKSFGVTLQSRLRENPGAVLAQIDNDLKEILALKEAPDIDKLRETNMLVPLLFATQAREQASAKDEFGRHLQDQKVGKMEEPYYGRMVLATGGALGLTVASAVIDAMFGKQGIAAGLELASHKLGEKPFELIGSQVQVVSQYFVETNGSVNGAQKVATGINTASNVLLGTSLIYAGRVKMLAERMRDLVRGGARPVLMPAILAGFIALGMAAQKKNAIEGAESQAVASQLDVDLTKVSGAVKNALQEIPKIEPLFQTGIQSRYDAAFKKGGEGFGSETAITQLGLKGYSVENLQKKFDEFLKQKSKKAQFHQERLAKARTEMQKINEKYRTLLPALADLKPDDGAERVLQLLAQDLDTKGKNFDSLFNALLTTAKDKASAGIFTNIFGKINIFATNPSFAQMLKMEQRYHGDFAILESSIKMSLLTQYLDDASKATGVDLRITVTPPALSITSQEMASFKLDAEKYQHITNPSGWAFVWPVPNQTEWQAIAKSVEKSGISNSLEKPESWLQRGLFIGGTASAFLFFLAGSVGASIAANRYWDRRRTIDLEADNVQLSQKERETVDTLFGYLNAYKRQFLGFLGDTDTGGDIEEALRARVQSRLREIALDEATTGLIRSKELNQKLTQEERSAFLNGTRSLPSKKLRNAYVASFNTLIDRISQAPEKEIPHLLEGVNGELSGVITAMNDALNLSSGTEAYTHAVQQMRNAYERFETESLRQQGEELVSMIENLYARKQALEDIAATEGEDEDIVLGEGTPPRITTATLIRSYMLAELDTEILSRRALVDELRSRGISVRDTNEYHQTLSQLEWDNLREKFLVQETGMMFGTATPTEASAKITEYLASLEPFIQEKKQEIDAVMANNGFSGTSRFEYSYNPGQSVRGPTIHLELMGTDGTIVASIPYMHILPNPEGDTTRDSQNALEAWLAPEGPAVQKLQLWSSFERTRDRITSMERNLMASGGPNLEFAFGSGFEDVARKIDEYVIWSEYLAEQTKKIQTLDAGTPLTQKEIALFWEPEKQVLPGGWKSGRTQTTLNRMESERVRARKDSIMLVVRALAGGGRRPEVIAVPAGQSVPVDDKDILARTPLIRGQIDFNRLP